MCNSEANSLTWPEIKLVEDFMPVLILCLSLLEDFMAVLVTSKFEDRIKTEGAIVSSPFLSALMGR